MKVFQFKKIDAFAKGAATGNPAGCIYLNSIDDIAVNEMQQIARELKGFVSEVGFLYPLDGGYGLKYYSSECEVQFCGHATIAVMYELIKTNDQLRKQSELPLSVNAGRLAVFNRIPDEDAVYIMAPEPQYLVRQLTPQSIAGALGIDESRVASGAPIELIDAGLRTLIVPLISLECCLAVYPDQEKLRLFCLDNDIDIILIYSQETSLQTSHYRTRVFAPKYGYLEDPATGSGNSAFGYYLLKQRLLTGGIVIEQGPSMDNPNIVRLSTRQQDYSVRVLFGGSAILRISGEYFLHG